MAAGDAPEVSRLLAAGADPDAMDPSGETVLFEAAASGLAEVVALLLLHGADPRHRSKSGMQPRDLAEEAAVQTLLDLFQGKLAEEGARQQYYKCILCQQLQE